MPSPNYYTEFQIELLKELREITAGIKAIVKFPDSPTIPDCAELLTVKQVALLLGWGESVVRQRDKLGLLPMPIRIGGMIQWCRKELMAWVDAGCPPRQKWEIQKRRKGA